MIHLPAAYQYINNANRPPFICIFIQFSNTTHTTAEAFKKKHQDKPNSTQLESRISSRIYIYFE